MYTDETGFKYQEILHDLKVSLLSVSLAVSLFFVYSS